QRHNPRHSSAVTGRRIIARAIERATVGSLSAAITSPHFALWCNGNTAPFGGVILGSNPSGAATYKAYGLTWLCHVQIGEDNSVVGNEESDVRLRSSGFFRDPSHQPAQYRLRNRSVSTVHDVELQSLHLVCAVLIAFSNPLSNRCNNRYLRESAERRHKTRR